MRPIINIISPIHQSHRRDPIPARFCCLRISLVVSVARESGADVEETTVGDRVLVVVACEVGVDLPS